MPEQKVPPTYAPEDACGTFTVKVQYSIRASGQPDGQSPNGDAELLNESSFEGTNEPCEKVGL